MKQLSFYINRDTLLSRFDPRAKLLATAALFAVAISFNHPAYLLGLLFVEALLVAAGKAFANVKRVRFLIVLLFLFSTVMWTLFLRQGDVLFSLGPLDVHKDSALYGLGMGMRLDAMVIAGVIFLSSTMVEEFVFALRKFGLPMPVAFAFSLAFRMVSQLVQTASVVKQAQRIRGLDVDSGGIIQRIRNHIPLVIPVFVCSFKTVDSLTRALEARGFGCTRKQTPFIMTKLRRSDCALIAASLVVAAAAIVLRAKGFGEVLSRL